MPRDEEVGRQADERGELLRHGALAFGGQSVALEEGRRIDVLGPGHGAVEPRVEVDARPGAPEVLRRRGVGRHHAQVVEVLARLHLHPVQDRREEHDARHGHAHLAEDAHEHGVAHGAVRLAEEVDRAPPAVVPLQPVADGAGEGVRVAVDREERGGIGVVGHDGPAGAGRIEEHDVRVAQDRVRVVLDRGVGADVRAAVRGDAARPDAAEVDRYRGRAGAAVERERHGAGRLGLARRVHGDVGKREHPTHELAGVRAHVEMGRRRLIGQLEGARTPREPGARGGGHAGRTVGFLPREGVRRGLGVRGFFHVILLTRR